MQNKNYCAIKKKKTQTKQSEVRIVLLRKFQQHFSNMQIDKITARRTYSITTA